MSQSPGEDRGRCKLAPNGPVRRERGAEGTEIDENGVDRAQIRAMLALSPEERLRRVEEFVESVLEIRERNGARPVF